MDPTATLHELLVLFAGVDGPDHNVLFPEGEQNDTRRAIHDKLDDLRSWIDRGGCYPQVRRWCDARRTAMYGGCVFDIQRQSE